MNYRGMECDYTVVQATAMQPGKKKTNTRPIVKGAWSKEEDATVVRLVGLYGPTRWAMIAADLPGRNGKQCRERWHNQLDPNIKKDNWTEEEDSILAQAHRELGNSWVEIAKRLPGRTDNTIKNRWNSAQRKRFATSPDPKPKHTASKAAKTSEVATPAAVIMNASVWGTKSSGKGGKGEGGAGSGAGVVATASVFVYSTPSMNRRASGPNGTPVGYTLEAPLSRSCLEDVEASTICDISCTPPRGKFSGGLNDTALSHNATMLDMDEPKIKQEPGSCSKGSAMLDFGCDDANALIQVGESTPIGHSTTARFLRSASRTRQGATNPPGERIGDSPLAPMGGMPSSEVKQSPRDFDKPAWQGGASAREEAMHGSEELGSIGSALRLEGGGGFGGGGSFSPSTFLLDASPTAAAVGGGGGGNAVPSTGKRRRDLISPPQRFLRDVRRPIFFSPSDEGTGSTQVPSLSNLLLDSARKGLLPH